MTHIKRFFFLVLAGVFFLSACNLNSDPVEYTYDNVMLVVNQGNFQSENGTVDYYHETAKRIEKDVIKAANDYSLGANIQSVAISSASGNMYVVCNEPDKVEIFDVITKLLVEADLFKDYLATPRYMAFDDNYFYITNWGQGEEVSPDWYIYPNSYVLVADRRTLEKVKEIPCGSAAEGIILVGNKLYVATGEGVAVINKTSGVKEKTIAAPTFTSGATRHFVVDGHNQLWASCPGNGLLKINLLTDAATEVAIPVDGMGGMTIAINVDADKIYTYETTFDATYTVLEAKIYELNIATGTHKEFASGTYFYSIGVSPATGNVYTAEVNNFSSPSELQVYRPDGTLLDSELTGIGTCDFKFFSIINTKQE
jgi:DNA-binding beta-propeller fold protein YncE